MKKEFAERIQKFLLEQQLTDVKVKGRGNEKKNDQAIQITAVDHVTQVRLETCRCCHLQEYFPHILDLELCKANHHPRGWVVANPVHSLHVSSQLEDASPASQHWKQPPILYGEEQQRTIALNTEGLVEYWCPLDGYSAIIHDDTTLERLDHLPTVHKQKPSQPPHPHHAGSGHATRQSSSAKTSKQQQQHPPPPKSKSKSTTDKTKPLSAGSSTSIATDPATKASNAATDIKPSKKFEESPKPVPSSAGSEAASSPDSSMKIDPPPVVSSSTLPTVTASSDVTPIPEKAVSSSASAVAATTKVTSSDSAIATSGGSDTTRQEASVDERTLLSEADLNHLKLEEDRIRLIRRSLSAHRLEQKKKIDPKTKKRKRVADLKSSPGIPGWRPSDPKELSNEQEEEWKEALVAAREKVERWMDNYRVSRQSYWEEKLSKEAEVKQNRICKPVTSRSSFYLPVDPSETTRCCEICKTKKFDPFWERKKDAQKYSFRKTEGDSLMQCLECGFIGCSPQSIDSYSRQHILQHLLISGHKFAVTCGERAELFCFRCGDFVYHEVFEQEKERIDYNQKLKFMSWNEHVVQRSFDAFSFIRTQDHGIVWRGLVATYPPLVPKEHCIAAQLSSRRQALFEGKVHGPWLSRRPNAMAFAAWQNQQGDSERYHIRAPVGMYNLGNTCFKSAVLQCLVHCKPLQDYFLKDTGHHYKSCLVYRRRLQGFKKKKNGAAVVPNVPRSASLDTVCLACEMDSLFLSYYGGTIGKDVVAAIEEASRPSIQGGEAEEDIPVLDEMEKGEPLVISSLLTSAWKSGGMKNLAGYEQRDAHEFLNSFLDLMGKNSRQYRERVSAFANTVCNNNSVLPKPGRAGNDIVKHLFEGTLRSVLLCEVCGGKRMMHEPFMNISLTLSKEVERRRSLGAGGNEVLSVKTCLEHFILPEKLGDSVICPRCCAKTPTKKQHTFSKLPKVLCLHLKRFDAATNKKIDEFVSFPARGLNLGPLLSHWCEVSSLERNDSASERGMTADPKVMYDLFGTVNHKGSMQSGHYVANVKVDNVWYHCNDAHITRAGPDDGEAAVLKSDGAYMLFYLLR